MSDFGQVHALAVRFQGVPRASLASLRVVAQKGAADIKRDAQNTAPVDTGNLRSSITYDTRVLGRGVRAEIGPTAEYGAFVEDGTSRMAPQPYMGPALDRNIDAIQAAAIQAAEQLL